MGFNKRADATVVRPAINFAGWEEVRQQGIDLGPSFESRVASRVVLQEYDPSQFLLSHCSIIASVDTEEGPGGTGKQMVNGTQIDRRYGDYYITPDTTKYINNNNDSWERKLLLSCFRTFVGGENYVEHVQIPELSKGKIIDAAARDIGDSVYVDILVATNKKHAALIQAITSDQLSTLSMGAQVAFTICSKCGNVAEDEIQLCPDIRYMKGNTFIDEYGKRRKIAELCGHLSAEPGSVKFIEASWVGNPAFPGAVLRNILDPRTLGDEAGKMIQVAFSESPRTADPLSLQKAAFQLNSSVGSVGRPSHTKTTLRTKEDITGALKETTKIQRPITTRQSKTAQGQEPSQDSSKSKNPFDGLSKDLYEALIENVADKVRNDLSQDDSTKTRDVVDENRSNESLIKSALLHCDDVVASIWRKRASYVLKMAGNPSIARKILAGLILYYNGGWETIRDTKRFSGREILAVSRIVDGLTKKSSIAGLSRIYKVVLAVHGTSPYKNVNDYLAACRRVIGRELTDLEKSELVMKGKLYSFGH